MAENEMKDMCGLPVEVRSTAGLGRLVEEGESLVAQSADAVENEELVVTAAMIFAGGVVFDEIHDLCDRDYVAEKVYRAMYLARPVSLDTPGNDLPSAQPSESRSDADREPFHQGQPR